MTKRILAIPAVAVITPVKPSSPAIRAITKKVRTQASKLVPPCKLSAMVNCIFLRMKSTKEKANKIRKIINKIWAI